jgi:hypothetical protein
MTFHFQCPSGHLLSADESQAGQQCLCPVCATLFIIPAPLAPSGPTGVSFPPELPAEVDHGEAFSQFPAFDALETRAASPRPSPEPAAPVPETPKELPPPTPPKLAAIHEPEMLHIPCPQGHMLETPAEMLDQEVMCPHCQTQFHLRRQDSLEYRKKRHAERERKERRKVQAWIVWAVMVVVLVLSGLVYLIVHTPSES